MQSRRPTTPPTECPGVQAARPALQHVRHLASRPAAPRQARTACRGQGLGEVRGAGEAGACASRERPRQRVISRSDSASSPAGWLRPSCSTTTAPSSRAAQHALDRGRGITMQQAEASPARGLVIDLAAAAGDGAAPRSRPAWRRGRDRCPGRGAGRRSRRELLTARSARSTPGIPPVSNRGRTLVRRAPSVWRRSRNLAVG